MTGAYVVIALCVLAAAGLAVLALAALQQAEHRAAGRIGEPARVIGPHAETAPLGWLALASVPVRRVRPDSIEFEDCAAMLLEDPVPDGLRALARAAARNDLVLAAVRPWGRSTRLVFADAGGARHVVTARSWRLLAGPPIERHRGEEPHAA